MGLFASFIKNRQKKEIQKFVEKIRLEPKDKKAERLILLYMTGQVKLYPDPHMEQKLKSTGMSDEVIKEGIIRIYHYNKGSEVPIMELQDAYLKMGQAGKVMWQSLNIHFYTSLAVSYDEYNEIITEMWNLLIMGSSAVPSKFEYIFQDDSEFHNMCTFLSIKEGDFNIDREVFFDNPERILPHFLTLE